MRSFRYSPRPNRAHEIDWKEWGASAFSEAQSEDKPILLSISAVWCHWCHVMDETSLSDPEVINFVNHHFVPIRVDNDQRPDINARYNMGGWPTTVFLTSFGDVIAGATYLAPQQLSAALVRVSEAYRDQKETFLHKAKALRARREERAALASGALEVDSSVVDTVARLAVESYDAEYGGFGSQPKFPMVSTVKLLLHMYQSTGDVQYRSMAEKTLDSLMNGGLYDHQEEGFFRYSTARDWSAPHFEKMLEDNAGLLGLYVHSHLVTGKAEYAAVASRTADYLNSHLYDASYGAFYGSQDADEGYYMLSLSQRRECVPPSVDQAFYTGLNAMVASTYLQAAWVLDRPELRSIALGVLKLVLRKCEGEPLRHSYTPDGDVGIPALLIDYAHLVVALADGYRETGEQLYLDDAQRLGNEMIGIFWDQRYGGFFDIPDSPEALGNLKVREKPIADNVAAIQAMISLFGSTYRDEYHEFARMALNAFVAVYQECGEGAAGYALATRRFLYSPVEVTVVGEPGSAQTKALLGAAATIPYPHTEVKLLDASDTERLERAGYWAVDKAQAYVCLNTVCLAPISDPQALHRAVLDLLAPSTQGIEGILQSI